MKVTREYEASDISYTDPVNKFLLVQLLIFTISFRPTEKDDDPMEYMKTHIAAFRNAAAKHDIRLGDEVKVPEVFYEGMDKA